MAQKVLIAGPHARPTSRLYLCRCARQMAHTFNVRHMCGYTVQVEARHRKGQRKLVSSQGRIHGDARQGYILESIESTAVAAKG
jgi:hypothetical protein